MKARIERLRGLAHDYETGSAKISELRGSEAPWREEVRVLVQALADVPADVLVARPADTKQFDTYTAQKLRALEALKVRLELLPGVVAKNERGLMGIAEQIRVEIRALQSVCRDMAGAQVEKILSKFKADLLPVFAGDEARAAGTAQQLANQSEAQAWRQVLNFSFSPDDPVAAAEQAIATAERFLREICPPS